VQDNVADSLEAESFLPKDSTKQKLIKKHEASTKSLEKAFSCLAYSFCSCSMVLLNKALASSFGANFDVLIVLFQNIVSVVLVELMRHGSLVDSYSWDTKIAIQWLPVNIAFCFMLFSGFMSLKYNNVPMVTIFKNLTNIFIVFGDWYFHGEKVNTLIFTSFLIMLGGAILAARNDLQFNLLGYGWMAANCLSTAGYVLYMRKATKSVKLSRWAMVFYNNILSVPSMLLLATLRGEMILVQSNKAIFTPVFMFMNMFTALVGFFLNFSSLWCVGATSATTYAILGSLNKIPITVLGYFLFAFPITFEGGLYMAISMFRGFLYSYAKL